MPRWRTSGTRQVRVSETTEPSAPIAGLSFSSTDQPSGFQASPAHTAPTRPQTDLTPALAAPTRRTTAQTEVRGRSLLSPAPLIHASRCLRAASAIPTGPEGPLAAGPQTPRKCHETPTKWEFTSTEPLSLTLSEMPPVTRHRLGPRGLSSCASKTSVGPTQCRAMPQHVGHGFWAEPPACRIASATGRTLKLQVPSGLYAM